jgi:hypothetical protein
VTGAAVLFAAATWACSGDDSSSSSDVDLHHIVCSLVTQKEAEKLIGPVLEPTGGDDSVGSESDCTWRSKSTVARVDVEYIVTFDGGLFSEGTEIPGIGRSARFWRDENSNSQHSYPAALWIEGDFFVLRVIVTNPANNPSQTDVIDLAKKAYQRADNLKLFYASAPVCGVLTDEQLNAVLAVPRSTIGGTVSGETAACHWRAGDGSDLTFVLLAMPGAPRTCPASVKVPDSFYHDSGAQSGLMITSFHELYSAKGSAVEIHAYLSGSYCWALYWTGSAAVAPRVKEWIGTLPGAIDARIPSAKSK